MTESFAAFSLATTMLAAATGLALWAAAGYGLARWVGFNRGLAASLAPALGWAVQNAAALALSCVLGLSVAVTVASAAALCGAWLLRPRSAPEPDDARGVPWSVVAAAAALAVVPLLAVLPKVSDGGVILAAPIFDHSKAALIDEMLRAGVPPVNPFYGPAGAPATVAYYYLWHFGAAQIATLTGATGWEADAAASWFTAFSTLLLMAGLSLRFGGRGLAPLLAVALCATGSLRPLLEAVFGGGISAVLKPATGFSGWLFQTSWSPHHVAGAGCVVVAVLLGVRLAQRPAPAAALVLGAVAAAAFQASLWVGGVVLAVMSVALAPLLLRASAPATRRSVVLAALGAGLLAVALAAPLLLAQYEAALGRDGGSPIAIRPVAVLGPLVTDTVGRVVDLPAYWLVLLVVEFPLIYGAGALTLLRGRRCRSEGTRAVEPAALALAAAVSLVASWLLVSTVGDNNDLGWRAVLPGLMVLSAAAGAGLSRLAERRAPAALAAALALFLATLPAGVILFRDNAQGVGSPSSSAFARSPALWAALRRHTPPDARIASNPAAFADMTLWPVNISWALLADRRSCFAGNELALAFAPLAPDRRLAVARRFRDVFDGTATPDDLRELAERYDCRAVLITPQDGAWSRDPFASSPHYRLAETDPAAWRIYVR